MSEDKKEVYLGDGLYASFEDYQLKLRAPRENGDHIVYMEPIILMNLLNYIKTQEGWEKWIRSI